MPTLLGADLIVKALAEEGITHIFTLPGGQMNPIHFAVDQEPGMRLIIPRHEGAGALMAAGFALTSGLCRKHGLSPATFYKLKAKYGGMDLSDAKRLKQLEDENAKLKRLLADAMLDNVVLKDLLGKP